MVLMVMSAKCTNKVDLRWFPYTVACYLGLMELADALILHLFLSFQSSPLSSSHPELSLFLILSRVCVTVLRLHLRRKVGRYY